MMEPFVQKQYDNYKANYVEQEVMSEYDLRQRIIDDLSYVSKMSVGEYTLYQKWCEIQERYPTHDGLFGKSMVNGDDELMIRSIKDNIWIPESFEDYAKLEPVMIYTKDEELDYRYEGEWLMSEHLLSLGLLGTVIGLLFTFIGSFKDLDISNVESAQQKQREKEEFPASLDL